MHLTTLVKCTDFAEIVAFFALAASLISHTTRLVAVKCAAREPESARQSLRETAEESPGSFGQGAR